MKNQYKIKTNKIDIRDKESNNNEEKNRDRSQYLNNEKNEQIKKY